jgi:hypothetical protein
MRNAVIELSNKTKFASSTQVLYVIARDMQFDALARRQHSDHSERRLKNISHSHGLLISFCARNGNP